MLLIFTIEILDRPFKFMWHRVRNNWEHKERGGAGNSEVVWHKTA